MSSDNLRELLIEELKDIYNAENQLVKALPKMAKAAHVLAIFSLGAFVAFVLGAISAVCGGRHGATAAFKHDHKSAVVL